MGPGVLPGHPTATFLCLLLPTASCPLLRPTPHQVQRRTATQVLHDDPQLRALRPEKHLSARGREPRATGGPGPQDTHSPAAVTQAPAPQGPTTKGPQQPLPAPLPLSPQCNHFADGPVAEPTTPTPHQKADQEEGRPGQHAASMHCSPTTPLPEGRPPRSRHWAPAAGVPECPQQGFPDAVPWGLPQPWEMPAARRQVPVAPSELSRPRSRPTGPPGPWDSCFWGTCSTVQLLGFLTPQTSPLRRTVPRGAAGGADPGLCAAPKTSRGPPAASARTPAGPGQLCPASSPAGPAPSRAPAPGTFR